MNVLQIHLQLLNQDKRLGTSKTIFKESIDNDIKKVENAN